MGRKYLNAQLDEDTELWQEFTEFQESEGYQSKSEAVRAAVRRGIMDDLHEEGDEADGAPVGFVAAGLQALDDEAYALVRDSVISTAVLLILSAVIGTAAPWWGSLLTGPVIGAALAVSVLGGLGGVIGLLHRIAEWAGYTGAETADSASGVADGQ